MADYTPVFLPGQVITLQASATITGGNLVEVSGSGTVAHAGAASIKVVGIAAHDAVNGQKVAVISNHVVHETVSPTGVTAGNLLKSVAAGAGVDPLAAGTFDQLVGVALTTAGAAATTRWMAR